LHDQTSTIEIFLNAAAARQPAPGGGSVAAMVGALAASMGEMVVNYSIGKKGLEAHAAGHQAALAQFHKARQLLLGLMAEDQLAYESLTAARKLAASDPSREEAIAIALLASIRVPEAMAATAVSILDLAGKIVDTANYFLLSDLAVCADLAMATTRCAIYNVRVNLPEITDAKEKAEIETAIDGLLSRGLIAVQRVSPRIWQRVAKGK
jgi:formiminotetrahydrofolate cyclodeaminase